MSGASLIRVASDGDETVISFSAKDLNRTDTARKVAKDVCSVIEGVASDGRPTDHVRVDFSEVERISSVGLNSLIQMNSRGRSKGVRLVFFNVPKLVREVFEITRLERMFDFDESHASSNNVQFVASR